MIDWEDPPEDARTAIQARTGPIEHVCAVSEGTNSAFAAVLHTSGGRVFVKGIRTDHPSVVAQQREAAINPHVRTLAPALRWHLNEVAGWNVLGFEHIEGRHPDYRPGSADLPIVVDVIQALGAIPCPDTSIRDAGKRWAPYLDRPAAVELFAGDTLLHTDYNPENILITPDGTARLIDWAWPTRGAAWIDPCCLLLRLIAAGHTAPTGALDTFTLASARLWQEIADNDPQPWKQRMARAAREWADARMTPGRSCSA